MKSKEDIENYLKEFIEEFGWDTVNEIVAKVEARNLPRITLEEYKQIVCTDIIYNTQDTWLHECFTCASSYEDVCHVQTISVCIIGTVEKESKIANNVQDSFCTEENNVQTAA